MSCINIYHPDYIKLLSEIDDSINPFELPTLIRLYQKMNNTDKIPSVSEIYEIDNRTKSQERINQIQDIQGFKDFVQGKQFQKLTAEEKAKTIEQVTKEHRSIAALKDLSAKFAHRIGGIVKFVNDTSLDYKGYNQGNTSVINLAYATSETNLHEILAHPIIRAIKNKKSKPDVILPIGTSGSGKSTFIKSLPQENLVVIEPDAMRVEFTGDMNDKSKDKEIYIEAANRAVKAIKQGKQVVFDTTNLTKDKRLPFIEVIKKEIPNANIQYKLMELNPELAKQRIKAQLARGENRANVSDETIDRHAASYKQMLEDIKNEPISNYEQVTSLYQSLLKELETSETGKKVFEQVKRDYQYKFSEGQSFRINETDYIADSASSSGYRYYTGKDVEQSVIDSAINQYKIANKYTLEEQQEEAIVTLLGLMAADKLDAKKDTTLISKLKELWKQISDFIKSLLKQDGIKIDELPITTTLNDLAEIMAYGNNKIILPGYKVEYSTPLGNKYDTLEEVNQEIRGLADANVEVDLSGVKMPKNNEKEFDFFKKSYDVGAEEDFVDYYIKYKNKYYKTSKYQFLKSNKHLDVPDDFINDILSNKYTEEITKEIFNKVRGSKHEGFYENDGNRGFEGLESFIEKNKEYEQSKEIIEQWKKENNIQYDPEEVYSRGQGFYSSIGAYSNLELDLLLKNLIQHIQDNKKADGEFTISAFTKPIDKRLKHIEGTGDRVRFVIYPKSEHIKWAAPTDVYSGSVWDAHEKVSKDKKSELLGVSFTKAPSLRNINEVSPNLAGIIDNLSHVHNELGIELTTNNFRIEYDDNIDYSTKKLIDNINKILDDKYGKLVKPEIKKVEIEKYRVKDAQYFEGELFEDFQEFNTKEEAEEYVESKKYFSGHRLTIEKYSGKQPTQTKENTTSIESVHSKIYLQNRTIERKINDINQVPKIFKSTDKSNKEVIIEKQEDGRWVGGILGEYKYYLSEDTVLNAYNKSLGNIKEKEYTSQALTNLKIAALKEVARKYPRSLITSKVVPINPNMVDNSEIQYSKVSSKSNNIKPGVEKVFNENPELASISTPEQYSQYLDTILPDSKVEEIDNSLYISVLNQLEQENIIEKDCSGGGKLKAEKGLQTNFNRGGKWKLIRDLKGYPTHKEGGVDLTIGKNGVSIRNGNTEFTAKHGLVIPKN